MSAEKILKSLMATMMLAAAVLLHVCFLISSYGLKREMVKEAIACGLSAMAFCTMYEIMRGSGK